MGPSLILRAVSIGVDRSLNDGKRLAIQITTLDIYWTMICIIAYFALAFQRSQNALATFHVFGFFGMLLGLFFIYKKYYDLGRFLTHLICVAETYFTADCYDINSGVGLFYIPCIMIPFVTFDIKEQWKGNIQVIFAASIYVLQYFTGTGVFFDAITSIPSDRLIAILFVVTYIPLILGFLRWQVKVSREKLAFEQMENLQASTKKILEEKSIEIAHEMNNPLQKMSLQVAILKDKCDEAEATKGFKQQLRVIDESIHNMGRMVHQLKHLAGKKSELSNYFMFSKILEDVLVLHSERLTSNKVTLYIEGDSELNLLGSSTEISHVLSHLLNEAIDGIKGLEERWIRIEVLEKNSFLQIMFKDSRKVLGPDVIHKLGKVQVLVERNNGRLYCDEMLETFQYIMLLPLA